jgi:DNA-directed RNA polymerase subunit N (RpoN/RPB10)
MPYYFEKPVWMGLIKMSAKYDRDPQVLVRQIIVERLVQEGFLKRREECLHERWYRGKRYVICWDCGTALGETEMQAEETVRLARQSREREAKLCRWNDELSHDFTAEDPVRCRRCGITYEEFYANYEKRMRELREGKGGGQGGQGGQEGGGQGKAGGEGVARK